jgi:hypothetical protein
MYELQYITYEQTSVDEMQEWAEWESYAKVNP